ncbi:MAG: branched-chain amino acid ABC transporter ATP-binding protein/permease [Burkholderiales bacterium]
MRALTRHPLVVIALALTLLPAASLAAGFTWGIASEIAILALAAVGFNLLLGYTGALSFGHGLFFGLGAYGTALAQLHLFPDSLLLPMAVGIALATIAGVVVGFLSLRRRGVYFSLLTMAFTALAFYVVYRWTDFTGGENGLSGVRRLTLAGLDFEDDRLWYGTTAAVCLIALAVLWRIVNSPMGTVFQAIRDHETRTRFIGYPVMRYKLTAFVLSAAFVGLAGTLMVLQKRFVSADLVHVNFSGEILAMTIFGGIGQFLGPALGALVYVSLREWLSGYTAAWQFWFGLAFMGFILFSPDGLVGLGARVVGLLRRGADGNAAMSTRVQPNPDAEIPAFLRHADRIEGALLDVRGVTRHFGAFRAVDAVDLTVQDRRLHALIGPNGAGKTTLFNLISGMFAADSGTVRLGSRALDGLRADQVASAGAARSFQITSLFQTLTVWENLRLACQARDPGRAQWLAPAGGLERVNEETRQLVRFLGLEGLEGAKVNALSYGGQRLVEIGLALACRPRLLMLDEPLVGLAAAERERVAGLIRRLSEHMGVLLVEHDIDRVFAIADTVTAMNEGAILCEGDADTVRAHPEVQRVYLGEGAVTTTRDVAPVSRPAVLQVAGVQAGYGNSVILRDVSFTVAEGEVVALLGRNGAGKSTTLKAILGLLPTTQGSITLGDRVISGSPAETIARLGVGLVPQGRRLFGGMTVEENLHLGELARGGSTGTRWTRERIFERFPRVAQRLNTHADQLSGGEQQMVAIARAMLGDVRVLLMDEPFEGLSPAMVDEVKSAVESLRGDIAIIIVEHHLDIVLALADRAVVLDRGQVLHDGPAPALQADRELRRQVLWV